MKDSLKKVAEEARSCRRCELWKGRENAVSGEGPGHAGIVLIGQAPGKQEDATGRPFVGKAGKFLDRLLERNGLDRKRLFITSAVKCCPPRNRKPRPKELKKCRPYLERQLDIIKPRIIVLMGDTAFNAFFPGEGLKKRRGKWMVRDQRLFLPTYHPSAGMRFPKIREAMGRDFRKLSISRRT